jgi:D-alanyl-D-alanine dipeptidase
MYIYVGKMKSSTLFVVFSIIYDVLHLRYNDVTLKKRSEKMNESSGEISDVSDQLSDITEIISDVGKDVIYYRKNNNTVIKNVYKGIILLIVPKNVNS